MPASPSTEEIHSISLSISHPHSHLSHTHTKTILVIGMKMQTESKSCGLSRWSIDEDKFLDSIMYIAGVSA